MKTKKKLIRKRNKQSKSKRGGMLMPNPGTDLINHHICQVRPGTVKDSPGLEIFTSVSMAFQLNSNTLGYLRQNFMSKNDKWFKFVIFNNDGTKYIYLLDGGKINKHSVCMIQGLLEVTQDKGEYNELREAVNKLYGFKLNVGNDRSVFTPEQSSICEQLIEEINAYIKRDIDCMPLMAAGSGSVNDDGTICINDKSGHYKPTEVSMELARTIFEEITGAQTMVKEKADKELLMDRYGEKYENYTGICL